MTRLNICKGFESDGSKCIIETETDEKGNVVKVRYHSHSDVRKYPERFPQAVRAWVEELTA